MYCDVLAILLLNVLALVVILQYIRLFLSGLVLFVILNYFHAEAFLLCLTQIKRPKIKIISIYQRWALEFSIIRV